MGLIRLPQTETNDVHKQQMLLKYVSVIGMVLVTVHVMCLKLPIFLPMNVNVYFCVVIYRWLQVENKTRSELQE